MIKNILNVNRKASKLLFSAPLPLLLFPATGEEPILELVSSQEKYLDFCLSS